MATKSIHIRIDSKEKKQLEELLDRMGLDIPSAVRVFFKKVKMTETIPFSISAEEEADQYTPAQLAAIDKLAEEALQEKNISTGFSSVDTMFKDILAEK